MKYNCCKSNFYLRDTILISEAYCWINSPFLVLSKLWLAGWTQQFWPKLLSKLTHENWLFLASGWIALISFKLILAVSSYRLPLILWIILSLPLTCLCEIVSVNYFALPLSFSLTCCLKLSFFPLLMRVWIILFLIHLVKSFSDPSLCLTLK